MSRTFYSEYVNHCLRFYARHDRPKFHSEADKHKRHFHVAGAWVYPLQGTWTCNERQSEIGCHQVRA